MTFLVYRCTADPDYFIITDPAHKEKVSGSDCPGGGGIEVVGEFPEMGDERVAFNEAIAKDAIENQGYYRIESKTFDPVAQAPGTMP